eukprot:Em0015g40a
MEEAGASHVGKPKGLPPVVQPKPKPSRSSVSSLVIVRSDGTIAENEGDGSNDEEESPGPIVLNEDSLRQFSKIADFDFNAVVSPEWPQLNLMMVKEMAPHLDYGDWGYGDWVMGTGYGTGLWGLGYGDWVMGTGLWGLGYGDWVMGTGLWFWTGLWGLGYGDWVMGTGLWGLGLCGDWNCEDWSLWRGHAQQVEHTHSVCMQENPSCRIVYEELGSRGTGVTRNWGHEGLGSRGTGVTGGLGSRGDWGHGETGVIGDWGHGRLGSSGTGVMCFPPDKK